MKTIVTYKSDDGNVEDENVDVIREYEKSLTAEVIYRYRYTITKTFEEAVTIDDINYDIALENEYRSEDGKSPLTYTKEDHFKVLKENRFDQYCDKWEEYCFNTKDSWKAEIVE